MPFQVHALPRSLFEPLFSMSDAQLADRHARRMIADTTPGFPCRVSLEDAVPGETVILTNFMHQPANTPYRSAHAVFVRQTAAQAFPAPGEVPEALRRRLISVRFFDHHDELVGAEVMEGERLGGELPHILDERSDAAYLHLHHAGLGCYAARVTRA